MADDGTVRLAELLGGLSLACDLADAFPPEKVLRTAVLAVELGKRLQLDEPALRDTFYASVLRYTGCTSFSHEEANIYGAGDDIGTRSTMALADASDPLQLLRGVVAGIGRGAAPIDRARAVARMLSDRSVIEKHARSQCEGAGYMARLCGVGSGVIAALEHICERWDGRGQPAGTAGEALPWAIRISHVADIVEIVHHRHGAQAALAEAQKRAGKHFDPRIVETLRHDGPELMALLELPTVWQRFLDSEPGPAARVPQQRIDDVARAFAQVADLKSTFTAGHSTGVATLAERAARVLDLPEAQVARVRRAALLHDLGRVAVPTGIWDKPGTLSVAQWERVRLHAYYTERVLFQAPGLRPLSALAAAAHERLDAGGYHRALPAALLEREARLLAAADCYHALREPRPQRPAHDAAGAEKIVSELATEGRLDRAAVAAVLEAAGHVKAKIPAAWPCGLSDREVEVLRRLARGRSNKAIASELDISPRTVQHHVAHVYGKIGSQSRAAATLFAIEHGLLE